VPVQDHSLVDLFVRMVRDAGLQTSPGWQFSVSMPGIASAGWEAFRDIWGAEQEKPDGLVVTDDLLLPGVFDGLSDCGVGSPDPLLLATHFTEGNPVPVPVPFIKLSYSPEEHARAMADLVLGALNGNDNGNRQIAVAHRCIMELDAPKPVGLPI
jgi:DNA-binding LacI/PurR family transcriptional regulator